MYRSRNVLNVQYLPMYFKMYRFRSVFLLMDQSYNIYQNIDSDAINCFPMYVSIGRDVLPGIFENKQFLMIKKNKRSFVNEDHTNRSLLLVFQIIEFSFFCYTHLFLFICNVFVTNQLHYGFK